MTALCPIQLRFHVNRLGSRRLVARLFGVRGDRVRLALPMDDTDRLHSGKAVMIGKILAKRCPGCGVARELEQFAASQVTQSGCQGICDRCRGK